MRACLFVFVRAREEERGARRVRCTNVSVASGRCREVERGYSSRGGLEKGNDDVARPSECRNHLVGDVL